ncbi:histidine phosphatase family protein [Herbaspirillum huttiense]|jgi:probable phosphoglycerate mutase|uniref:histidine phosphatase family protein n=1 Tax=Herbaspirillum TaxID=963 RepID=UPI000C094BA2|nr:MULTISPECIES: histidine phosphatase family protein [Herbaspirillum]MAF02926.1 histidine phosphatase family protein [Herbaspirillum sp.]MBN9354984.1 histidine phosphatase family protein [Herbaspirillum huttiense]MBO18634.1 histidine phosphatase family protein [Herbaspirillum sp.]MCP3654632.1 histidine phosphatase family protein [Herbaspirillum sp.]MCP3948716.1 histidine phosphatase family protein [Herbaspirillum sp.]
MTDILLIRHGETDWNVDKRLQGHIDIGLNEAGQRQVLALGEALAGEGIDAVFASDLQRARDTAQAVAGAAGLAVQIDAGLRERCYGGFEGLRHTEIEARYPEAYRQWKAREPDFRYPAGERIAETMREFYERSVAAVQRVLASGRYRKVAIVTHGGVLECVHHWASQTSFAQPRSFDIFNASVNRLHWDGERAHIRSWGEIGHLQRETLDEVDR